eukprot:m.69708 g.69708  ORF g.69708 m.69708 type:complete len:140 (-) comp12236_c0_seq2:198-617(-)
MIAPFEYHMVSNSKYHDEQKQTDPCHNRQDADDYQPCLFSHVLSLSLLSVLMNFFFFFFSSSPFNHCCRDFLSLWDTICAYTHNVEGYLSHIERLNRSSIRQLSSFNTVSQMKALATQLEHVASQLQELQQDFFHVDQS